MAAWQRVAWVRELGCKGRPASPVVTMGRPDCHAKFNGTGGGGMAPRSNGHRLSHHTISPPSLAPPPPLLYLCVSPPSPLTSLSAHTQPSDEEDDAEVGFLSTLLDMLCAAATSASTPGGRPHPLGPLKLLGELVVSLFAIRDDKPKAS